MFPFQQAPGKHVTGTRRPGTQLGPFGDSDESQQPWLAKLRCQEHFSEFGGFRKWMQKMDAKCHKRSHTNIYIIYKLGEKTTTLCQPDARGAAAFAAGVVVALVAAVPVPSETLTL